MTFKNKAFPSFGVARDFLFQVYLPSFHKANSDLQNLTAKQEKFLSHSFHYYWRFTLSLSNHQMEVSSAVSKWCVYVTLSCWWLPQNGRAAFYGDGSTNRMEDLCAWLLVITRSIRSHLINNFIFYYFELWAWWSYFFQWGRWLNTIKESIPLKNS